MDTQAFLAAYRASRNGTNQFHFNRLYPKMRYSDGVRECAVAGCYWLLDILGTELAPLLLSKEPISTGVEVKVTGSSATISTTLTDELNVPLWVRSIDLTDMPEGTWTFLASADGDGLVRLILPSEY